MYLTSSVICIVSKLINKLHLFVMILILKHDFY